MILLALILSLSLNAFIAGVLTTIWLDRQDSNEWEYE